jgi:hypothetical protein
MHYPPNTILTIKTSKRKTDDVTVIDDYGGQVEEILVAPVQKPREFFLLDRSKIVHVVFYPPIDVNIDVKVYVLIDARGNHQITVADAFNSNIVIGGYDANGVYQQFESEGYHLHNWAEAKGFKSFSTSRNVRFDLDINK